MFRTKCSDRWSQELTPEGVLDMALRGTEAQWWELYRAVRQDAELRALLARLLERADPDFEGGRRLWQALIRRLETGTESES